VKVTMGEAGLWKKITAGNENISVSLIEALNYMIVSTVRINRNLGKDILRPSTANSSSYLLFIASFCPKLNMPTWFRI